MEAKTLLPRLKRIEGRVRGLQRMVEQGESCQDILAQLMAARAGLDQAGQILLDQELERCLSQRLPPDQARLTALRRALRLRARFS